MTSYWDDDFDEKLNAAFEDVMAHAAREGIEYYPGSTRPIIRHPNRIVPERPHRGSPAADPGWDENPRTYTVNGEDVEFFSVGQLARALGREPGTIRKWEAQGVIPKATFQVPGRDGDPRGRRRLYSRKQVEGLVQIAEDEGLMDFGATRKSFNTTQFKPRVLELFRETLNG